MDEATQRIEIDYQARPGAAAGMMGLYGVESLASVAGTMLIVGIYFFTKEVYRWTIVQNFLLAAAQGAVYAAGALAAEPLTRRWGRNRSLVVLYLLLAIVAAAAAVVRHTPWGVAVLLLTYAMVIAASWPMLESLFSQSADPHELSRSLGRYNLVWAATGAAALAAQGTLIQYWPAGVVFLVPAAAHLICAVLMMGQRQAADAAVSPAGAHEAPEQELLRQRRVALWLSRIAMPATYVAIYGLSAMLPSLALVQQLPVKLATLVGSVWLASRFAAFWWLGATVWWHTRPGVLLWAAIIMLAGFWGTVGPGARPDLLGMGGALGVMVAAQLVLGAAIGMIYSASLYFGMVLSEGSTEHGGYHEALIGLGQVLGPGAGAAAAWVWPGSVAAGIAAVSVVIVASVVAAGVAKARAEQT
jgi:MFS family permease